MIIIVSDVWDVSEMCTNQHKSAASYWSAIKQVNVYNSWIYSLHVFSSQRCVRIVIISHILNINTKCLYCQPLVSIASNESNGFASTLAQSYSMTDHIFSHYFSKSQVLPIISAVFKDKSHRPMRPVVESIAFRNCQNRLSAHLW